MKPLIKGSWAVLINHTFQVLLVTYLILLLIEQIWTGLVSVYLKLNYLLIIVIVIGVIDVLSEKPQKKKETTTLKDYVFIGVLSILGTTIIKYKTTDLGILSWIIAIIAGTLILLLSILVLEEDEEDEHNG